MPNIIVNRMTPEGAARIFSLMRGRKALTDEDMQVLVELVSAFANQGYLVGMLDAYRHVKRVAEEIAPDHLPLSAGECDCLKCQIDELCAVLEDKKRHTAIWARAHHDGRYDGEDCPVREEK